MPPQSKRTVRSRADYSYWHPYQLASGHDFFNAAWGKEPDPDVIRQGWQDLGECLLQFHVTHYPGTRPWAWWYVVAPERRRRVDGKPHPFEDGSIHQPFRQLYYGRPRHYFSREHFEAMYESQQDYLARLRLLTAAERRALDAMAEGSLSVDNPSLTLEQIKAWWGES